MATLGELKSLQTPLKLPFNLIVSEIQSLREAVNVNPALQDGALAGRVPSQADGMEAEDNSRVTCVFLRGRAALDSG